MLWALVVMCIIPGCKCFFIVARSIIVTLQCLIPVWQQCNMERGEILLPKIATDYPNKLLPCLARYTVLSLPWHVLHNKPKYLLQGTSKNVSLFLPYGPAHLTSAKYAGEEWHSRLSLVCVSVKLVSLTRQVPRVLPPPWREELGNEVVTCAQSSACYVV